MFSNFGKISSYYRTQEMNYMGKNKEQILALKLTLLKKIYKKKLTTLFYTVKIIRVGEGVAMRPIVNNRHPMYGLIK